MGTIVTMPRRSATLHQCPLAIVPIVGCSLACAPYHHPLAPCAVEDHVLNVRTRLVLRLPWGPLTQAQDVTLGLEGHQLALAPDPWCTGFSWEC